MTSHIFTGKCEYLSTARGGSCDGTTAQVYVTQRVYVVRSVERMGARLFAADCGLYARARLVDFLQLGLLLPYCVSVVCTLGCVALETLPSTERRSVIHQLPWITLLSPWITSKRNQVVILLLFILFRFTG